MKTPPAHRHDVRRGRLSDEMEDVLPRRSPKCCGSRPSPPAEDPDRATSSTLPEGVRRPGTSPSGVLGPFPAQLLVVVLQVQHHGDACKVEAGVQEF